MKKISRCMILFAAGLMLLASCHSASPTPSPDITAGPARTQADWEEGELMKGGVVCDYVNKRYWPNINNWSAVDPLKTMMENGMDWVRVGVTTNSCPELDATPVADWNTLPWKNETWSSREYAGQILKEAQSFGMRKILFFFLSDDAAHAGQQKTPKAWKDLSIEELEQKLYEHCRDTVKYYLDQGITIDIYEIGNEIERGILDYRPYEKVDVPDGTSQFSSVFLAQNVWNIELGFLKAAIRGVKESDPDAKIGLHTCGLAITSDDSYITGFYDYMIDEGVDFDYIGLSYYWFSPNPGEPYFKSEQMASTISYLGTTGKRILFSEWAYANSTEENANTPDKGYPYTPEGQQKWVHDFMAFCDSNPFIDGTFYFYPEYYPDLSNGSTVFLESCGLFKDQHTPMPALKEFGD